MTNQTAALNVALKPKSGGGMRTEAGKQDFAAHLKYFVVWFSVFFFFCGLLRSQELLLSVYCCCCSGSVPLDIVLLLGLSSGKCGYKKFLGKITLEIPEMHSQGQGDALAVRQIFATI